MRNELELMQTIDNYLKGKLSEADKTAFEKKINADPELKKEVELQKQLLKGVERTGLKQSAKQAGKKYKFNRTLRNWGLTGLVIAIVASAIAFYKPAPVHSTTRSMSSENSAVIKNVVAVPATDSLRPTEDLNHQAAADPKKEEAFILKSVYSKNNLAIQTFTINSKRDTVISSRAGVKLKIDKNSFSDMNGKAISGPVKINLQEAITPYDIAMANLVTKTDNKVLQSGGMLHITASSKGQEVQIPDNKSLTVSVPTKKKDQGMQLFEGKEIGNSINWVNPKPLSGGGDRAERKTEGIIVLADTLSSDLTVTSKGTNTFAIDNKTNYIFSLSKLGWANIDRLSNDPRTKEIELITKVENKNDFSYVFSRIAFPNQNMFIPGYEKKDGTYSFTHGDYETTKLPVGETAVIIATAAKNGKIFFASKKLTIQNKQTVNLTLKEVTDPELRKILKEQLATEKNFPADRGDKF
ncbi:MAG: hypothetical protein ACJ77K_10775 [Bacteroidia bacterium]